MSIIINIFSILVRKTLKVPYYLKCEWKVGVDGCVVYALLFVLFLLCLTRNTLQLILYVFGSHSFLFCLSCLPPPRPLYPAFLLKPINKNSAPGFAAQNLPNGYPRYPSFGDASSHPSSRHPSVGSARLPSVGEESTHPLLVAEEQVSVSCCLTG